MKSLIIATVILGMSMLQGCAAESGLPGGYVVLIDSSFSDSDVAAIETGMSEWSSFKDGPSFAYQIVPSFSLPVENKVGWTNIVVRKADAKTIRTINNDPNSVAVTNVQGELSIAEFGEGDHSQIGPTIYLQDSAAMTDNEAWNVSIRHECGHALGLHHSGPNQVMYPNYDNVSHKVTCDDLQNYCNLRHISCDCN